MALRRSIPKINLSVFKSTGYRFNVAQLNSAQLEQTQALHSAFHRYGFAYIVGVSEDLVSSRAKVLDQATRFFGLPKEEKMSIRLNEDFRGYQGLGLNITGGVPDKHEGLDFMRELDHADLSQRVLKGRNLWPSLGNFKTEFESYITKMHLLGDLVLRAAGFGAMGDEAAFAKYCTDPFWVLRAIHYPPVLTGDRQGCGEHTDYGCLTFIADNGAEDCVQCRDGASGVKWMDLCCPDQGYIVNIGDALASWSGGLYNATPHRVMAPGPGDKSRVSVCFFYEPNHDSVFESGTERRTYGEHLAAKCYGNFVSI